MALIDDRLLEMLNWIREDVHRLGSMVRDAVRVHARIESAKYHQLDIYEELEEYGSWDRLLADAEKEGQDG